MEIIKFFFRKKTLTTVFYIVILATIREAAAIGADEGYEQLVNQITEYYNNQSVIIGGLLLLLFYTKGSYLTLAILIGLCLLLYDLLKVEINSAKVSVPYLDLYVDKRTQLPSQNNRGPSPKGFGKTFSYPGHAPYKFVWKWDFFLRFVNVSNHTAYNVSYVIQEGKNLFDYVEPLPVPLSIKSDSEHSASAFSEISKEISGNEGKKYRESFYPEDKDFQHFFILVEYQNSEKVKFYTLYEQKGDESSNTHFRYKPEPFAKYSWFQKLRIKLS